MEDSSLFHIMHRTRVMGARLVCVLLAVVLALAGLPAVACADEEKVDAPTVQLSVIEADDSGAEAAYDATDAAVGEAIRFRATGTLPYNIADFDAYTYAFHIDIADTLVLDESTVTVTLVTSDGEAIDVTSAFSVSYEDGELVVACTDIVAIATLDADCTFVVEYEAALDASVAQTGSEGVAMSFASIVYTVSTSDASLATTVEDEADVYTWQLVLEKLDADTLEALEGATFAVQAQDGRYVTADGTLSDTATQLSTDADGLITLSGLASGAYTFTETAAPSGYTALDAFTVTISADATSGTPALAASVSTDDVAITQLDTQSGTVGIQVADPVTGTIAATIQQIASSAGTGDDTSAGTATQASSSAGSSSGSGSSSASTGDVARGIGLAALIALAAIVIALAVHRRRREGGVQ